jgi:hypothetical protein
MTLSPMVTGYGSPAGWSPDHLPLDEEPGRITSYHSVLRARSTPGDGLTFATNRMEGLH